MASADLGQLENGLTLHPNSGGHHILTRDAIPSEQGNAEHKFPQSL